MATAASAQFGLPGYLPDAEALPGATPQQVFAVLRSEPDARIVSTSQQGVASVEFLDDPTHRTYVFFGKAHWAYPSVMRLRRAERDGVWATRIAYLCGANERICKKFQKKLQARKPQIALADTSALERAEIKQLVRPLPVGPNGTDPDFWIVASWLNPEGSEYGWRRQGLSRDAPPDPSCKMRSLMHGNPPNYPENEEDAGVGGMVITLLTLDGSGSVVDATIERSSRNRRLDMAAINAVSTLRFSMIGCASTTSIMRVRLPFEFVPPTKYRGGLVEDFDAETFGY